MPQRAFANGAYTMRMTYDKEADAVYIYVTDAPYARGKKLDEQRRIDYDSDGDVHGIELFNVSYGVDLHNVPFAAKIGRLLEKRKLKVSPKRTRFPTARRCPPAGA